MTALFRCLTAAALAAALAAPSPAAIITTIPAWDGTNSASPWGPVSSGASPTYGQSFTATATDSVLTGMTFEINNASGSAIPYQAYVYQWTGSAITGPALFTSAVSSVPSASGFQAVTVSTGAVALTPGLQYAAFFSTIGDGGPSVSASWGLVSPDTTYPGGTFLYNNSATFAGLFTPTWDPFTNFDSDLAFTLTFQDVTPAVPEPATLASFGMGLVTLAGYGWRRRRAAA